MRTASKLLWLAALAVVALQAMALATRYFQPWLDGDYLLPERFAADMLRGNHPLAGWTLSSSPYLFPDLALSILWRAVLGTQPLLPYQVVTAYLGLAIVAGWSLRRVLPDADQAWLMGALLVDVLLAWQGLADHARWLWWLGVPTFHGGAVLLGLAQFALWAGPPGEIPSRARRWVAGLLAFAGLLSDTLLFTQFMAPLGGALFATSARPRLHSPRLRAFLLVLALAYVPAAGLRLFLQLAEWGNYPAVVRYLPTPSAVGATAAQMLSDLAGPIASAVPGFLALGVGGALVAAWRTRRARPGGEDRRPEQRQATWFAALCLLSTTLLPILAVYWRNPQHGRYLLPWLVVPLWWLASTWPLARLRTPLASGAVAAALLATAAWQGPKIDFTAWSWPHPEAVTEVERLFPTAQAPRGLASFWTANYLNAVSRIGLRLNQLRPDGRVQFWGNNAFHHFETDGPRAPLRAPRYSFIIVDGLDPEAVRAKFGAPERTVRTGSHEVWLYDDAGAQRMSALVDEEVRAFLGHRPGTERIAR